MITLCIQCHNFQRRLCWMLSSLADQTHKAFTVDVAFFEEAGSPTTVSVLDMFRDRGLDIVARPYDDFERFERRGLTRNDQLRGCRTPWVWFCDSDHVYHPEYLVKLVPELERLADETRILTAGRMSSPVEATNRLVDSSVGDEPVYVGDTFKRASAFQALVRRRSCGAGHTQIARMDGAHGGVYVEEQRCRDWSWSTRLQKARSDIQFRSRCGGSTGLPEWFSVNQIHLNHHRDNKFGRHLEDPR